MANRKSPVKRRAKKAPLLIRPNDFRKLTKSELSKLGLGERSERYVSKDAKRVTTRTRTISKRQYLKGQRGGLSNERYLKEMKPRVQKFTKTPGGIDAWNMPLDEGLFNRRMVTIRKRYPKRTKGSVAIFFVDAPNEYMTDFRFLGEITYDVVRGEEATFNKKYFSDRTVNFIERLELRVYR